MYGVEAHTPEYRQEKKELAKKIEKLKEVGPPTRRSLSEFRGLKIGELTTEQVCNKIVVKMVKLGDEKVSHEKKVEAAEELEELIAKAKEWMQQQNN